MGDRVNRGCVLDLTLFDWAQCCVVKVGKLALIVFLALLLAGTALKSAAALQALTKTEIDALGGKTPVLIFDVYGRGGCSMHLYDNGHFGIAFFRDEHIFTVTAFRKVDPHVYRLIIDSVDKHNFINQKFVWRRQPDAIGHVDGPSPAKVTYFKNGKFNVYYADRGWDRVMGDVSAVIEANINPSVIANQLYESRLK